MDTRTEAAKLNAGIDVMRVLMRTPVDTVEYMATIYGTASPMIGLEVSGDDLALARTHQRRVPAPVAASSAVEHFPHHFQAGHL